ncbi:hypothetical protein CJ030_MR2G004000 [Morella rubra]|uniref:FBD domain-containing protein n=1 Tax=Morella rubra TaxID=262757 RepID=A0A6A1WG59_9ROSI|nr:hypothetical protein CJ030_MR2G004000 [Morella rubra]
MSQSDPDSTYWGNCEVMIFGDNLKGFVFDGEFFSEYYVRNALSLEQAEIKYDPIILDKRPKQVAYRLYKLLIGLSNVKHLTLYKQTLAVLTHAAELLPHLPLFPNLIDLELMISQARLDCVASWRMLQRCPRLETLKFSGGIYCSPDFAIDSGVPDQGPPCFASSFKCIEVNEYGDEADELLAVKILLKNAVVLDKMVVYCCDGSAVSEQLLELPRGSKSCEVVLFH